jgi:hypothetical protein
VTWSVSLGVSSIPTGQGGQEASPFPFHQSGRFRGDCAEQTNHSGIVKCLLLAIGFGYPATASRYSWVDTALRTHGE